MPANGTYLIFLTAVSIALLLVLILAVKLHAFLALLLTSMALGLAAHMPPENVLKSIQTGFGEHNRIVFAALHFAQPRIDITAQVAHV